MAGCVHSRQFRTQLNQIQLRELSSKRDAAERFSTGCSRCVALFAAPCCVTVAVRRPCAGPVNGSVSNACKWLETRDDVRTLRMSQQPELTTPSLFPNPASAPGFASGSVPTSASGSVSEIRPAPQPPPHHAPQRIPHWLVRAELFLRVLLRMYIGLAVCYAPWSKMFWDRNPLFMQFPTLSIYAANGAVRGLVSGLGLLNLWIAFQDALRHRDG